MARKNHKTAMNATVVASQRKMLLQVFNEQLTEFVEDIRRVFPTNVDIKTAQSFITTAIASTPRLLAKVWFRHMVVPYRVQIDAGDISFFINKNYEQDVQHLAFMDGAVTDDVTAIIERFREPVRNMSPQDQQHSMKHIQQLTNVILALAEADAAMFMQ